MSRIACLVVPRFAVAALRRAEPELRGCALAVCEPRGVDPHPAARRRGHGGSAAGVGGRGGVAAHARVIDVSPEAARLGIQPGLSVAQAVARHADLIVRPLDRAARDAARAALLEAGASISPRVEAAQGGEESAGAIYLDADGLDRLLGSSGGILAALLRRAEKVGLEGGVAIADGKATARIAAGLAARRGEAIVVPPGGDAAWLAPLPLAALAPIVRAHGAAGGTGARRSRTGAVAWPVLAEELGRLGLVRLGDLAALPAASVATRLGECGAHLWRVAAGCDGAPLIAAPVPLEVVEGAVLEYGVSSIEGLLFVVRGLLDRAIGRLGLQGLACRGLIVSLGLEGGAWLEREVRALAPTRDVKTLTLLVRAAIEAVPPSSAVESVRVTALPDRARPDQLDLFRAPGPPPERLATTLARLASLCGHDRVGSPVAPEGHRPEAFSLAPFDVRLGPERGVASGAPPRQGTSDFPEPPGFGPARLALRALRPARPAQVFFEGGRIAYVRAPGLGGRVIAAAGPWRIEAEWWSDAACSRDYYEMQLSDGGLYRLYRAAAQQGRVARDPPVAWNPARETSLLPREPRPGDEQWFVCGIYD